MKKFITRVNEENKKQNDSLFFNEGDTPMTIKVELDNGEKYELLVIVRGEKELYKDGKRIDADIRAYYENDEMLQKDMDNGVLELEHINWFELIIYHNGEPHYLDYIFYTLTAFENYTDEEILNFIIKGM